MDKHSDDHKAGTKRALDSADACTEGEGEGSKAAGSSAAKAQRTASAHSHSSVTGATSLESCSGQEMGPERKQGLQGTVEGSREKRGRGQPAEQQQQSAGGVDGGAAKRLKTSAVVTHLGAESAKHSGGVMLG